MSEPPRFFVYIVESPSAPDIYHGRSEGALVARALSLDLIPAISRTVINREALEAALRIGLPEAMSQLPEHLPIVHLSAHGGNAVGPTLRFELAEAPGCWILLERLENGAGSLALDSDGCQDYCCANAYFTGEYRAVRPAE